MASEIRTDESQTNRVPPCRYLRSKGMYITGQIDPADDYDGVGDGNCWCNQTQNVLGPDDGLVDRPLCRPERVCYLPVI